MIHSDDKVILLPTRFSECQLLVIIRCVQGKCEHVLGFYGVTWDQSCWKLQMWTGFGHRLCCRGGSQSQRGAAPQRGPLQESGLHLQPGVSEMLFIGELSLYILCGLYLICSYCLLCLRLPWWSGVWVGWGCCLLLWSFAARKISTTDSSRGATCTDWCSRFPVYRCWCCLCCVAMG